MGVCTRHCSADDMKQVLPKLARPHAGLKGVEDKGGMPLDTIRMFPMAVAVVVV